MDEGHLGPLDEEDWEQRRLACCRAILQLRWMVGRWRGQGTSSSGPIVSSVESRMLLGGTFLESRERTYRSSGQLESEDITIYGAAPEKGPGELWAQIYMLGGVSLRYTVYVYGESVLCEPEGYGARLSFMRDGDGYRARVYFPDADGLWVEDATLHYERVE